MSGIDTSVEHAGAQAPATAPTAKTYEVNFVDSRLVCARILATSEEQAVAIARWAWANRRDYRLAELFDCDAVDIEDIFENAYATEVRS